MESVQPDEFHAAVERLIEAIRVPRSQTVEYQMLAMQLDDYADQQANPRDWEHDRDLLVTSRQALLAYSCLSHFVPRRLAASLKGAERSIMIFLHDKGAHLDD